MQRPKGAEIPRSANSLPRRAIARGCSPRPCAGSRKHRRRRLSMVENRSRRTPTPICVQRPRGAEIPRSANSLPRRAIARGCSPAPCAGSRKHRRRRLSMVEHWSYRPPMQSIGVTGYPRSGKLPAPPRHRSSALSQTVRGQGGAALTRRIAPSRSAQLGSSPILKSDYRRRSSTPCVRLRGCLRLRVHHRMWAAHRSLCARN